MQRWKDFNGTNSFYPAAVRVGYNADTILYHLRAYSEHTYPNGFQRGNPHGIENCSTVPNTINEMLCMGNQNLLRVFAVWPVDKNTAFFNIRSEGAFLVSSVLQKKQVQYVRIISEQGRILVLQNPWPGKTVLVKSNKRNATQQSGEPITLSTGKREELMITAFQPLNPNSYFALRLAGVMQQLEGFYTPVQPVAETVPREWNFMNDNCFFYYFYRQTDC